MRIDTLNFTLVGVAVLLLAVAVFRSDAFSPLRTATPKNPIGFQP